MNNILVMGKITNDNEKKLSGTYRSDRREMSTDGILDKLPSPKNLHTAFQKKWFRQIGSALVSRRVLNELDLHNLEIMAIEVETYWLAHKSICDKNEAAAMSGLIQTFKSGASNVTAEYTLREKSFQKVLQISRLLGLSIRDRAALNAAFNSEDPNQLDMFEAMAGAAPMRRVN